MRKIAQRISICLSFLLFFSGLSFAMGTPLLLDENLTFSLDLNLETGKSYALSMDLRTDFFVADVSMVLCGLDENGEMIEFQRVQSQLLESGQWQKVFLADVLLPDTITDWQLKIEVDRSGQYYWQNLNVQRVFMSNKTTEDYWNEKLATQGSFYTGLVVDARHLDLKRGMSPRIYSESGQLLYGGVLASADLVQEQGVVAYGPELTPQLLSRLAVDPEYPYSKPLVVEAIQVADPSQTGVYLNEADTQRVLEAMAEYDFFARYAVIFLLN